MNVANPVGADNVHGTSDDGFNIQSGSLAIDRGMALAGAYSADITGISRPRGSGWDIGAYEYTGSGGIAAISDSPTPVNGLCGAALNSCSAGDLNDIADSILSYLWNCSGRDGGSGASCSLAKSVAPLPPAPVSASAYHVRPPGQSYGNGSGLDWNNAYSGVPATLQRGATYYLADGTYNGYAFDDPANGSKWITVKKAIESDHGSNVGWNGSMGLGTALFNGSLVFLADYFDINGQRGGGPGSWTGGFGFKVKGSYGGQQLVVGQQGTAKANYVKLSHIDFEHRGDIADGGIKNSHRVLLCRFFNLSECSIQHFLSNRFLALAHHIVDQFLNCNIMILGVWSDFTFWCCFTAHTLHITRDKVIRR